MSNSTQITENLLTAVDIIVEEKLRALDFDKTEQYTITDISKADQQIYSVTDGTVTFEAFSINASEKYKIGDTVLVNIPKNDFSNPERTILRKASKYEQAESGKILKPFDQIIDVSGNLLKTASVRDFGLSANKFDTEKQEKFNVLDTFQINQNIYKYSKDNSSPQPQAIRVADIIDEEILKYTNSCPYLGISAQFKAPINQSGERAVSGQYGLKISIYLDNENNIPYQTGYLTNDDFLGDSYNIVAGVNEQKVFYLQHTNGVSQRKITRITIDFFQCGDFLNSDQDYYGMTAHNTGTTDPFFNQGTSNTIIDNIFVSQLFLCSAFLKDDYVANKVEIFSNSPIIYDYTRNAGIISADVFASWLYCGEEIPTLVYNLPKKSMKVYWYFYDEGALEDRIMGVNWTLIKETRDMSTSITLPKDMAKYEVRVAIVDDENVYISSNSIIFTNRASLQRYQVTNDITLRFDDGSNGFYPLYDLGNDIMDENASNIIRSVTPLIDTMREVDPASVVSLTWEVPDPATAMIQYRSSLDDKYSLWTQINSYISLVSSGTATFSISDNNYSITLSREVETGNIAITVTDYELIKELLKLKYTIKDVLEFNHSLNIKCSILFAKTNNQLADDPHSGSALMTFMQANTSGSPFTVVIQTKDNNILTIEDESLHTVWLKTTMIDENGDKIIFDSGSRYSDNGFYEITYEWKPVYYKNKTQDGNLQWTPYLVLGDQDSEYNSISFGENLQIEENYHIIKATIQPAVTESTIVENKLWERKIILYYAVPIRRTTDSIALNGTTEIVYDSSGILELNDKLFSPLSIEPPIEEAQYDLQHSYIMIAEDESEEIEEEEIEDSPILIKNEYNILQPINFFLDNYDKDIYSIIVKAPYDFTDENNQTTTELVTIWTQPVLIWQRKWASTLINQWDGDLIIDEERNYILSAVMGAGTKNDENEFSGVLMGNLSAVDGNKEDSLGTGLYGFQNGVQTFAFKEDGTAFIGSGDGRLNFDGKEARIYNSNMIINDENNNQIINQNGKGLIIDFDNASLEASYGNYTIGAGDEAVEYNNRKLFINGLANNYPLAIGNVTSSNEADSDKDDAVLANPKANFAVDWDGTLYTAKGLKVTGNSLSDLREAIENYLNDSSSSNNGFIGTLQEITANLQDQIDGTIDTYYFPGEPNLLVIYDETEEVYQIYYNGVWNESDEEEYELNGQRIHLEDYINEEKENELEWFYASYENDDLKNTAFNRHLGDLYLDTITGLGYRFLKNENNEYIWQPLDDAALQKALTETSRLSEALDGKMSFFQGNINKYDTNKNLILTSSANFTDNELYASTVLDGSVIHYGDQLWTPDGYIYSFSNTISHIIDRQSNNKLQFFDYWRESAFSDEKALSKLEEDLMEYVNTSISNINLDDQQVIIWFGQGEPIKTWNTNEEKDLHIGDLYYNENYPNLNSGESEIYKYQKNGDIYSWEPYTATQGTPEYALIESLRIAQNSFAAADGQMVLFITRHGDKPDGPFHQGDMWLDADKNEIYICLLDYPGTGQDYDQDRYWLKSKYTDDTAVQLLALGNYVYVPASSCQKTAFLLGDTIYSPKIFGGTTLGVGLNVADNTGVLLPNGATIYYTNEQDRTRGLQHEIDLIHTNTSLNEEAKKAQELVMYQRFGIVPSGSGDIINDPYNFRVYSNGALGIGPRSGAASGEHPYNFYVNADGSVQMSGAITWSKPYAGQLYHRLADNSAGRPDPPANNTSMNNEGNYVWHKTYNASYDYWISFTTDGGQTWTDPIRINARDGAKGDPGTSGTNGVGISRSQVLFKYSETNISANNLNKATLDEVPNIATSNNTNWSSSVQIPSVAAESNPYFLYTNMTITYTNGTEDNYYTKEIIPKEGRQGIAGPGISEVKTTYKYNKIDVSLTNLNDQSYMNNLQNLQTSSTAWSNSIDVSSASAENQYYVYTNTAIKIEGKSTYNCSYRKELASTPGSRGPQGVSVNQTWQYVKIFYYLASTSLSSSDRGTGFEITQGDEQGKVLIWDSNPPPARKIIKGTSQPSSGNRGDVFYDTQNKVYYVYQYANSSATSLSWVPTNPCSLEYIIIKQTTTITDPSSNSSTSTFVYNIVPTTGEWNADTVTLALKDLPNGVFPMGSDGNIGINATAIRTGHLEGITINVNAGGKIGNWAVLDKTVAKAPIGSLIGSDSLTWSYSDETLASTITSNDIGTNGTIALIPNGSTTSSISIANSSAKTDWRLLIGSNFGVDSNGNIYANSGKIGDFSIASDRLYYEGSGSSDLGATGTNRFCIIPKGGEAIRTVENPGENNNFPPTSGLWKMLIGNNFGVDSLGNLFATGGLNLGKLLKLSQGAGIVFNLGNNYVCRIGTMWGNDGTKDTAGIGIVILGEEVTKNQVKRTWSRYASSSSDETQTYNKSLTCRKILSILLFTEAGLGVYFLPSGEVLLQGSYLTASGTWSTRTTLDWTHGYKGYMEPNTGYLFVLTNADNPPEFWYFVKNSGSNPYADLIS